MNDFAELAFMETPLIDAAGFMELILRFVLNMVVVVVSFITRRAVVAITSSHLRLSVSAFF